MTTMELIEKHGIGFNCLSDAYDLGVKQGRADERTKVIKQIKNVFDRYNPSYSDIYNVITELEDKFLEQIAEVALKEQTK